MEELDAIAAKCGETEEDKGFREDWYLADELERIADHGLGIPLYDKDTLRKAAKALRNNYVGTKLALVAGEVVGEALETLRDHGVDGLREGKGNFAEELADAHIRLFALEHLMGISPSKQVLDKMDVNKGRPRKHGRLI